MLEIVGNLLSYHSGKIKVSNMRANFSFQQRWSNREKKLTSSQKQLINWKKKHMKQ